MSRLSVPPLFARWFDGRPPPACLLAGEGTGLAELVAELWMERFRGESASAELVRWNTADVERELPDAAFRTPSFFFRYRVFLLPDLAEVKKAFRDRIAAYLGAPDPSVVLVIPCSDRGCAKTIAAIRGVLSASPREDQVAAALARHAEGLARAAGKNLAEDAASFLVRWVGLDAARLAEEMKKLLAYAAGSGEIGEEEIRQVCVAKGAADPFSLAEMLMRGDGKGCLSMFRRFAANADSSDYHALVGAVAWCVRRRMTDRGKPLEFSRGGKILDALSAIDRGMKGESGLSAEQLFEIRLLGLLS